MNEALGLNAVVIPPGTLTALRTLVDAAGAPAGVFDIDPEKPLSLTDYFRLRERIALALGDETIHVSLRPLIVGTSRLVHERLHSTRTVREMLETLADGYNVIHGGEFNRVKLARNELVYVVDDRDFPYYTLPLDDPFILFSLETLLVYVHLLLQSSCATGEPLPLHSVRTRRAGVVSPLTAWGVPIAHDSKRFELRYDRTIGHWPVDPASCPILGSRTVFGGIARVLEGLGAAEDRPDDIVLHVADALRDGFADQRSIANQLGMSIATLRRRLAERGSNFREVRARTHAEIAEARLAQGATIADIAEELGYSDGRSFARAFRAWTGCSPRDFRDHLRD